MVISLPFEHRTEAGSLLAESLKTGSSDLDRDAVILALVRGGVVVGRAVADALHLPLHVYVVRKLGHPGHREYGLGAIAEGGATYLDDAAMEMSGVTWEGLQPVIEEEKAELQRRRETYLASARPSLRGKRIILVDDGAATGGTLFAAIEDLRQAKVKRLVIALPVCPPDTAERLKRQADDVIVLATPEPFEAVGKWYRDFRQVDDSEVLRLLSAHGVPGIS